MKLKQTHLLILLALLLGIYFALNFWGDSESKASFNKDIISYDSMAVDLVEVSKDATKSVLKRTQNGEWRVLNANDKYVSATAESTERLLSQLAKLKPSRIVSRKEENWPKYQVDSTGTRLKVFEGENQVIDIILGRSQMANQEYVTYVRPYDEDNVYAVPNFLSMAFSPEPAHYRNKKIIETSPDSITKIKIMKNQQAYVLLKKDSAYFINDQLTDSAKVASYLNSLKYVAGTRFQDKEGSKKEVSKMTIDLQNGKSVSVSAFLEADSSYVISSSQNPDNRFFDDSNLFDRFFKDKEALMPESD